MLYETPNQRLAQVLDSLYLTEPREILLALRKESQQAKARLEELSRVHIGIGQSALATLIVPSLSQRMLDAFWTLHLQNPSGLAPRKARRAFCEQTALIVGETSMTFDQAVALCQESHHTIVSAEVARQTYNGIRNEILSRIDQEKSFLDACCCLEERIVKEEGQRALG